jgi:hypothetical protein
LLIVSEVDGYLPMPQSLPVPMASSTRAWTRRAASMQAFWPRQPRVCGGRLVTHSAYRQLPSASGKVSCAGVRPLAAGEQAHRFGPAGQLVPAGTAPQR